MRRPRPWASSAAPPTATGPSPGPGFMPRCARTRKRRGADFRGQSARPCRTPARNGALKGRPFYPRRHRMAGPEPKILACFTEALRCQTVEGQAAYLEQACQGDAELRARLDELLQAHREVGSFLEGPSASRAATIDEAPVT